MTSTEVLSMYENIAGLTTQMAAAARMSDWNGLDKLEAQCADASAGVTAGGTIAAQPAGSARQRKIDLLKQILANDRAIRDVTESWINQVAGVRQ
ncbi:MAG: flagellar protein FliT [Pseudomonadota bacterium]